jgi:hypothetical protein
MAAVGSRRRSSCPTVARPCVSIHSFRAWTKVSSSGATWFCPVRLKALVEHVEEMLDHDEVHDNCRHDTSMRLS